jgi:hypothetical protein
MRRNKAAVRGLEDSFYESHGTNREKTVNSKSELSNDKRD